MRRVLVVVPPGGVGVRLAATRAVWGGSADESGRVHFRTDFGVGFPAWFSAAFRPIWESILVHSGNIFRSFSGRFLGNDFALIFIDFGPYLGALMDEK